MRPLLMLSIVAVLTMALPAGAVNAKNLAIKPLLSQVAAQGGGDATAQDETGTGNKTGAQLVATEVDVFEPSGASYAVEGSCWTGSVAALRADAWRCMVGNAIYDPCFGPQDAAAVICVRSPLDESENVQINLTEALPEVAQQEETRPWVVELADGTLCQPLTGTLPPVPGERVIYGCADGSYIQGALHVGTVWTAHRIWISPAGGRGGRPAIVAAELAAVKTLWF